MIRAQSIRHQYDVWKGDEKFRRTALDGVDLDVAEGEFIAILGANGSGKSTLAKHLNVLLLPDEGVVHVSGMDTADEKNLWEIRTTVGMVFQNPDNQIIGTSVEEDVAFGPENKNLESRDIQDKVTSSLKAVGLLSRRKSSPTKLSGGQKQRVAIAGVLACDSRCIVFDEPTAMLDPASRKEVLDVIRQLHQSGKTIILITHHTDEVVDADRIILMEKGRVAASGTPQEIFSDPERLRAAGMDLPPVAELAEILKKDGAIEHAGPVLDSSELIALVMQNAETVKPEMCQASSNQSHTEPKVLSEPSTGREEPLLEVRDLCFTYARGTVNETKVLQNISFDVHRGECIGLIGTTGAGKTTLARNLNGLLKADSGDILYKGESIYRRGYRLSNFRKEVGLVFQRSETQLFCKTVLDDVAFGPKKMGLSEEEARKTAEETLALVGIDEEYYDSSPMDLSGGQKRRVALAGVLSMGPSVLILDEPAAGLDPVIKAEVFGIINRIREEKGTAIILISHEMEDIARYADKVLLLAEGGIKLAGSPGDVFSDVEKVRSYGADVPAVTSVMYELAGCGLRFGRLETGVFEAAAAIESALGKEGRI